jgi:YfiH family protein
MHRVIIPDNLKNIATAFFTGKYPGADISLVATLGRIGKEQVYLPIQKHTDKVLVLETSREPKIADAVITQEKGILIGIQTADCVPILLYDRKKKIAGAVHAGWRGTASSILKKTVETMMSRFSGEPADILVAIGPSIRACSYEVGYDVFGAVRDACGGAPFHRKKGEKYYIDLAVANHFQALSMGVPEKNIWVSEECTFCNPEKFFSYRYALGSTGRQGGFIGIF